MKLWDLDSQCDKHFITGEFMMLLSKKHVWIVPVDQIESENSLSEAVTTVFWWLL